MEFSPTYLINSAPATLQVVDLLDFQGYPILNLEKDTIGNNYLTYLLFQDQDIEQRAVLQVSKERLNEILVGNIRVKFAYDYPENNSIFIYEFQCKTGQLNSVYLIPDSEFIKVNPVFEDYLLKKTTELIEPILDNREIFDYSVRKQKLILDVYLQSQNLVNSIKPYAFYKVFTPLYEMLKDFLQLDQRNADKSIAFSNIREHSLGISIEVNASQDLFLEKESKDLNTIMSLLAAGSKEELIKVLETTNKEAYLKEYIKIIKAVIDNDASFYTAYANPITKEVVTTLINKEKALIIKKVIDEEFATIEDVENIRGKFLEIDISGASPSFKIISDDEEIFKGKIDLSILETLRKDYINLGAHEYILSIKTIYYPATTVKSEETKRFLIGYSRT